MLAIFREDHEDDEALATLHHSPDSGVLPQMLEASPRPHDRGQEEASRHYHLSALRECTHFSSTQEQRRRMRTPAGEVRPMEG
jgi:hypothetical protein